MSLRLCIATIIPLIALFVIPLCNAAGPPPTPVNVEEAQIRNLAPLAWFAGSVLSKNSASLPAEVEGKLTWVAEVGTHAQKNETVARLDDTFIRQQLIEQEAIIGSKRARLEFLERELKRLRQLANQNNAAQSRLDEVRSEKAIILSEIKAATARENQARERLKRTQIRTPFTGVVTERYLQSGEWVGDGNAVVMLVDPAALEIQAWVTGDTLNHIDVNQRIKVKAGDYETNGLVTTIIPVANPRSRLHELRIAVLNSSLSVGQPVRVAVPTASAREVVSVSRDAMVLRRTGITLYRIKEDMTAEAVNVQTGVAMDAYVEVIGDIHAGDAIVVRGGERLRPGQTVKMLDSGDK
jgi:RND family efflux transporter MFP subunit